MVIVYHATTRQALKNILRHGLCTRFHRLKTPAVWVYGRGRHKWAVVHMLTRHGVDVEDIVILELRIPKQRLVRCHTPNLWSIRDDVAPECIVGIHRFITHFHPSHRRD